MIIKVHYPSFQTSHISRHTITILLLRILLKILTNLIVHAHNNIFSSIYHNENHKRDLHQAQTHKTVKQ